MHRRNLLLTGIGNPLVDFIIPCEFSYMHAIGITPGGIDHISRNDLDRILVSLPPHTLSAGGGAANTCRMASQLGGDCIFAGCTGSDALGDWYSEDLIREGVRTSIRRSNADRSGVFCTFIHPDRSRTILVAPGAADNLEASDLDPQIFRGGGTLLVEGFLARKPSLFEAIFEKGARAEMTIVLDLASSGIVKSHKDLIARMVSRYCDMVFANEEEFDAFTSISEYPSAPPVDIGFVVKRGERGAYYRYNGKVIESNTDAIDAVDPTGAGDAFTAGFLCAQTAGFGILECLRIANHLGGRTVLVHGAVLPRDEVEKAWSLIARSSSKVPN